MTAIKICHGCALSQKRCAGPCVCTVNGIDITVIAAKRDCPKGKHADATESDGPRQIEPVPREEWPRWAGVIWLLSNDRDAGVGDTVQRWAAKLGGEKFKKFAATVHLPCGCSDRQAEWNALYPYTVAA